MKTYEEYMTSINEKANIKIAQRKRRKKIWASSAVSLCLLAGIGIGVRNVMPKPLNIPQNSDPSGHHAEPIVDTSLNGLAVENFKLSDIQTGETDRLQARKLSDFFLDPFVPDMLVYVRVLDTEQWEDKTDRYTTLKQMSSARVIEKVWCKYEDIPENIVIEQSLNGGCMGDEKTNMVRKGGVYLLPLKKDGANEKWHVIFDLDVLFEVDNEGRIWSHSPFEKFRLYDGKDTEVLSEDMAAMTSDANFSSAITPLGQMVVNWGERGTLAEVTIAAVESAENIGGFSCYQYTFGEFRPLSPTNNPNVGAISYTDSNPMLKVGSRYLIMLDYSENGPYIEKNNAARINEDRTISPVSSDSRHAFVSLDGYTVEQITESIEQAVAWRNAFGEK